MQREDNGTTAMIASSSDATETRTAGDWMLIVVVALLVAGFLAVEHDVEHYLGSLPALQGVDVEWLPAGESLVRWAGFALIGLCGAFLLMGKRSANRFVPGPLAFLLLYYFLWCVLSILWSTEPMLTSVRLAELACCVLGAAGLARRVDARSFCLVTVLATTTYVAVGVGVEMGQGRFQPLSPDYRFAGTLEPGSQGVNCALMVLAAFFAARGAIGRTRFVWIVLLVAGLTFLLLTKSRLACGALLFTATILGGLALSRRNKLLAAVAIAWIVVTGVLVTSLVGIDLEEYRARAFATLREADFCSLTGRVRLWEELLPEARARPWVGHGYCAFWDTQHVEDMSAALNESVSHARSAYVDSVLGVGLVGTAALMLAMLLAICRAASCYHTAGDVGYGFLLAILLLAAVHACLDPRLLIPASFSSLAVFYALVHLGFRQPAPHARPAGQPEPAAGVDLPLTAVLAP